HRVDGAGQLRVGRFEIGRMGRQRLKPPSLDPAIGECRCTQTVSRAIIGQGNAVLLAVEKAGSQQWPRQQPAQAARIGLGISAPGLADEIGARHSLRPVLATPCTKLRRRMTKRLIEGMSTRADAALRRPRSTVKPVWNRARPTSIV